MSHTYSQHNANGSQYRAYTIQEVTWKWEGSVKIVLERGRVWPYLPLQGFISMGFLVPDVVNKQ